MLSKDEIRWSPVVPVCDSRGCWSAIKRAVNLDRLKLLGIIGKKIPGPHASWVEGAFPTRRGERRRAEKDAGQREGTFDVRRFWFKQVCLVNRFNFGALWIHGLQSLAPKSLK